MRRLAHELSLAPNALYRYFRSREILVASVADETARRIIARVQAALDTPERGGTMGPAERVRTLAREYIAFGAEHPALYTTLTADRREAEASLPKPLGQDLLWALVRTS